MGAPTKRGGRAGADERRRLTLEMYASGAPLYDILEATGYTSLNSIYMLLRAHGIKPDRRPRERAPVFIKTRSRAQQHERHQRIAALYAEGLSTTQLAERFGCSGTVVRRALEKFDVTARPRGGYHGR